MDRSRNADRPDGSLDARSLALSALLGTHPPVLPGRALTALAELFGIPAGTMRTALSRMVAAGELDSGDGRYRLTGRLLQRQRAQDLGRRRPDGRWDGTWHLMTPLDDRRPLAERRRIRRAMADGRVAELRPGLWLRPANLEAPDVAGWIRTTGPLAGVDPAELAASLWDLDGLATDAAALADELAAVAAPIATHRSDAIPAAFQVAASVVRHLRADPLLPALLLPPVWPADALRATYDAVEADLQAALRDFFRAAADR